MNSFIKYKNKRWRPKPQLSFSARKAKRHPYTSSKRFDRSCRNHGACGYCATGRQHAKARQVPIAEWDLIGAEELVLDEWDTYADPWDWGTIFEMSFDKEDELKYNERLLKRYDMPRFGIMIKSRDPDFDGSWLSESQPTTKLPHEAMHWTSRDGAARYLHNRFVGDPNLHVMLYVEEIHY